MLAGQMDYTPGGLLNVTKEQFKQQTPAIVWNTRAAELSKFVIYESPLTVVCDHPDNILGKAGSDFLKIVPTVWDDIEFLGGYPGEYEKGKTITGLEKVKESILFHAGTKKTDEKVLTTGGRVLAISSYGNDMKEALVQSYKDAKKVEFDGKYYRRDIGFDL